MNKEQELTKEPQNLYIAGIGTSAGGIDSLSKLLSNIDGSVKNLCFIILQHLSPSYKSELSSILARGCKWPVVTVISGTQPQAGQVYVTPENKKIIYKDKKLELEELSPDYSYAPSIDDFFISLAEKEKQYAIGIILSGTASDGTRGIQSIKEHSGFTIAQLPVTAQYQDMPLAAIESGFIDAVVEPSCIFDEIVAYIKNDGVFQSKQPQVAGIDAIFQLLSNKSGIDFSQYKQNTILRRIDKRIETLGLRSIMEYYEAIVQQPGELDILFDTVLIGVTNFFRDKEAFELLEEQLRKLVSENHYSENIRIWSAGCATGEEPYSIAILFHEILGEDISNYKIQVFASDVDERALAIARKGIYAEELLTGLPAGIRKKYFQQTENGYQVNKLIKDKVLFSRQNLIKDPPFVKLDLVVCRNLLIYFNHSLQKEALKIFNYSLKNEGLLFLGKSESITVASDLFVKVDGIKLFRKVPPSIPMNMKFGLFKNKIEQPNQPVSPGKNLSLEAIAKETFYYSHQHPFIIINENGDIKESQGSLRLYLELSPGAINPNVYKMVNKELVVHIRSGMAMVKKTHKPDKSQVVRFEIFGKEYFVQLRLQPLVYPFAGSDHYMLMFESIDPESNFIQLSKKMSAKEFENYRIKELEHEVSSLREHLQTFTEELETSNEEMQSINEELQSANEELKSSNEELETSNEELQSANEELNSANTELRQVNTQLVEKEIEINAQKNKAERNEHLYKTVSEHLPNGTVGILDADFRVEFVAGQGLKKFNLVAEDMIGKKLPDLNPSEKQRENLRKIFTRTLAGETCESEISFNDFYYTIQTVPLKNQLDEETKIMYLTQDVTEKKKHILEIKESETKFQLLANNIPVLCWRANPDGYIYWYNSRWYEFTGKTADEMVGWGWQSVHDPAKLDDVMEKWQDAIKKKKTFEMVFPIRRHDGVFHQFLTQIYPLIDDKGNVTQWFGTNTDITEQIVLEESLKQSEAVFRGLADTLPQMIWMTDKEGRKQYVSKRWTEYAGKEPGNEIPWKDIIHPEDNKILQHCWNSSLASGEKFHEIVRLKNANDCYCWHVAEGVPLRDESGQIMNWVGAFTDIHDQKIIEQQKDEFISIASHEMKTPLTTAKGYNDLLLMSLTEKDKNIYSYAQKSNVALERLHKLILELLDASKIQNGELSYNFQEFDFEQMVQQVVGDMQHVAPQYSFEKNIQPETMVFGDQERLQQVIVNLLNNAIKYSPADKRVIINSSVEKNKLLVSVQDFGIGIPIEHLSKVFDKYHRINEHAGFAQGLGIGLYLCNNIINRHGGEIWAESALGTGSIFYFSIPIKD